MTKDQAIMVNILICTMVDHTDNATKKVTKISKQIKKKLSDMYKVDEYLKPTVFGYKRMPVLSQTYQDIQTTVSDAWDKTRKDNIPKDGKLDSSMGELLTGLYNSLNRSEYKELFITEQTFVGAVNSYSGSVNHEDNLEASNNSRLLVNGFLENIGVAKDTRLSKRRLAMYNDLIIEGKI